MEKGLRVENLKAYYFVSNGNVKAVDNISFALDDGESLGIAGESASGKSTPQNRDLPLGLLLAHRLNLRHLPLLLGEIL